MDVGWLAVVGLLSLCVSLIPHLPLLPHCSVGTQIQPRVDKRVLFFWMSQLALM